jgi:hypothetical protein
MDINDLHDLRDGKSIRKRRAFNPFIHVDVNRPLMRMLFNITRPPEDPNLTKLKKTVKKQIFAAKPKPATAGGSMVSYRKEHKQQG